MHRASLELERILGTVVQLVEVFSVAELVTAVGGRDVVAVATLARVGVSVVATGYPLAGRRRRQRGPRRNRSCPSGSHAAEEVNLDLRKGGRTMSHYLVRPVRPFGGTSWAAVREERRR
ncbi:MAG: hypothetical protein M3N32_05970 [Actinomycetota bacterium]|nr:hypothetical protein [Actinomycetota bacterium]